MNENFTSLAEVHEELALLFFEHQKALLDRDQNKAAVFLREYEKEIQHHTGLEEEWLLPIYEERVKARPGGDLVNFVGEHSKILMYLERLKEKLAKMKNKDGVSDLISLLDDEARFKELIRHHDEREERFLFPELDKVTSQEEKINLLLKLQDKDEVKKQTAKGRR
ncbi:MAG TPA: hemerythrin domain-containing protein [bacterium]|jgi:hemerythrin-like domain-containing protein|nr:hemerythrin domain-containing protein [bacterium]